MNRWLYPCIVLLLMIVCSSNDTRNNHRQEIYPIVIDEIIKIKYPGIYKLLEDSLINGQWPYRLNVFDYLRKSDDHELYFVEGRLDVSLGGETGSFLHYPDSGWRTKNTITLNSVFLQNGCKEYLVQVIVHESIHAFINWCKFSYDNQKNGVDSTFLKKYFSKEKLKWFSRGKKFLNDRRQHILMSESFIDTMKKCIYAYTNPASPVSLRDTIALSLAWAGLEKTPLYRKQTGTCLMKCIDIESRNFNASQVTFEHSCCRKEHLQKFLSQLKYVFQIYKSVNSNL